MEFLLVLAGAVAGAGSTYWVDLLRTKRANKTATQERVIAARHQALEAGQCLALTLLQSERDKHDALLAVSQAVNRLTSHRDLRAASRFQIWMILLALDDAEIGDATEAQSDFILHMNDPLDPVPHS